ncbi:MAG: hypothetical protein KJ737_12295 [Proteobacteria bacterium]|nr:hypothetical protein [Pseudomonadota bacterium]
MILFWVLASTLTPASAAADDNFVNLLLTANLNGRFSASAANQDKEDPMLIMAQSLINAKKDRPVDLFVDLGNAFYPGLLSRFSYGSIMMDFLDYFNCAATLVSSQDLNIGISNLEFLSKEKQTRLLSANIEKQRNPVFLPYFIQPIKGKNFAFIGISSEKGFFDIAEKKLLKITLKDFDTILKNILAQLEKIDTDYIVLLSGRPYSDNFAMMEKFKEISLCISGGDATGELYSVKAERIDIGEGRSLITLTNPDGFYSLTLSAEESLTVNTLKFNSTAYLPTNEKKYLEFANRLSIWKERFVQEGENEIVKDVCCGVVVDDARVTALLRHRFRAEVAILEENSISPGKISGRVNYSNILRMVDNEFPIFTFKISGSELKQVFQQQKNFVFSGTDGDTIQGYSIENKREYLICSPQSVYDRLVKQFNRDITYKNSWRTISDEIKEDLKGERVMSYGDYGYLDNRYRMLVDISLSNFYNRSNVSRDADIDTPPGKPVETYEKWGLDDKINFTIYNQYHKFVITPYIFYIRQDDNYFQNLLRGTLFYTYNLYPVVKPYHKSQVDTVLKVVDGLRPLLFRETLGALFETEHITGKAGIGFEKQAHDPQEDLFLGIETIVAAKYEFLDNLKYSFDLDTFYSNFSKHQIRTEITNSLSFKLNSFMAFSTKYKWFYFNSLDYDEKYKDSQILLSLDLVTDFKRF